MEALPNKAVTNSFLKLVEATRRCSSCKQPATADIPWNLFRPEARNFPISCKSEVKLLKPMKSNAAVSRLWWLTILIIASCIPCPAHPQIRTETIEIDPKAESQPFPHYWERMFGSG